MKHLIFLFITILGPSLATAMQYTTFKNNSDHAKVYINMNSSPNLGEITEVENNIYKTQTDLDIKNLCVLKGGHSCYMGLRYYTEKDNNNDQQWNRSKIYIKAFDNTDHDAIYNVNEWVRNNNIFVKKIEIFLLSNIIEGLAIQYYTPIDN